MDEFRRLSEGKSFHIVKFSEFLNLFGGSEKVVGQVQREEVSQYINNSKGVIFLNSIEQIVYEWLLANYPNNGIEIQRTDIPNILIYPGETFDGTYIGADIYYTRAHDFTLTYLTDRYSRFRRFLLYPRGGQIKHFLFIIVCSVMTTVLNITKTIENSENIFGDDVSFIFGLIDENGKFIEVK